MIYETAAAGTTVFVTTHYMDEAVQADRVVVMDGGNILTDGDPRTVFAQVELLKRHKLDVPQATELIYRLNAAGCSISGTPGNNFSSSIEIARNIFARSAISSSVTETA